MNSATPAVRDLARRLIALEAARDLGFSGGGTEAERACEKLRVPLARFAGVAGYRSLVARALAMAKAEAPSLERVQVRSDGSLDRYQLSADGRGLGRHDRPKKSGLGEGIGMTATYSFSRFAQHGGSS